MNGHEWLAERFETNRSHLRAVAYRLLGSASEADDAVQDSWLRRSRSYTSRSREPKATTTRLKEPGVDALRIGDRGTGDSGRDDVKETRLSERK